MTTFDERRIASELLTKYDHLQFALKGEQTCYAVSSEWFGRSTTYWFDVSDRWYTFKFILEETRLNPEVLVGQPGPMNNINLLYDTSRLTL